MSLSSSWLWAWFWKRVRSARPSVSEECTKTTWVYWKVLSSSTHTSAWWLYGGTVRRKDTWIFCKVGSDMLRKDKVKKEGGSRKYGGRKWRRKGRKDAWIYHKVAICVLKKGTWRRKESKTHRYLTFCNIESDIYSAQQRRNLDILQGNDNKFLVRVVTLIFCNLIYVRHKWRPFKRIFKKEKWWQTSRNILKGKTLMKIK